MNPGWSYILTAIGVFGLWLAGRKDWRGWLVGLTAQGVWLAYAVATQQWGFIVSAFAYGWVYALNIWRMRRKSDHTPCMMFDDMPVERQNTMSNYVTKTIKTILTDLARGLENSLLKESSYIFSPGREKTSWKDAFFDNPDLCPHCGRRQYALETRQVDKGIVTYVISLCIFEDCEDHCVCHFNTNHL